MRRAIVAVIGVALVSCGSEAPGPAETPPPTGAGGAWTALAPMLEARQEVCVAVVGGRVFVAGGLRTNGSTAATFESYDPATGAWTMLAPLPQPLDHCNAAAVGSRMFVLGGMT